FLSEIAIQAARAQERRYARKTSAHWYDTDAFYNLASSLADNVTVRQFIAEFDGCSKIAGQIANGFSGPANKLTRKNAATLLARAKQETKPIDPKYLGSLGKAAFEGAYARDAFMCKMPPGPDGTSIQLPVVLECWASPRLEGTADAHFLVNSTPCIADVG